jgi:hypothetical protein
MLLPALSRAKSKAQRITCANNQKQIGLAVRLWADNHDGKFPWKVEVTDGGVKPDGSGNATVDRQFAAMSNEVSSTKILLCPSDTRKLSASNFFALVLTNISYALCTEASETRPRVTLATDRNMSGFDFTGLTDNINCFILSSPDTGARTAKWRKGTCHGENTGNVVLSDGSVQQWSDRALVQTLIGYDPERETDEGTLQYFFP